MRRTLSSRTKSQLQIKMNTREVKDKWVEKRKTILDVTETEESFHFILL